MNLFMLVVERLLWFLYHFLYFTFDCVVFDKDLLNVSGLVQGEVGEVVFVLEFEEDCAVEVNGHHEVKGLLEFGVGAFS